MFLVRDLVSPRTWLTLIHHWVGLFMGIAALTVFTTFLSLGASLLVVALIGLPILGVMVWAADLFARAERARFALLLGVRIPGLACSIPEGLPVGHRAALADARRAGHLG